MTLLISKRVTPTVWGFLSGRKSKELHRLVCGKLLENHDPARITQNHSLLFFGLILNYTKGGQTKFVFSLEMKMPLHTLKGKFAPEMTETYVKEDVAWRTMVKVLLSNSFLERRNARRKFSESLGVGASQAPRTRQRISLGSENDWKFRHRSYPSWKASSLSLEVVVPT